MTFSFVYGGEAFEKDWRLSDDAMLLCLSMRELSSASVVLGYLDDGLAFDQSDVSTGLVGQIC